MAQRFVHETMVEIVAHVSRALQRHRHAHVAVRAPSASGCYPGEADANGRHWPLRVWTDLASRLDARLLVVSHTDGELELRFERLERDRELLGRDTPKVGKYAPGRGFERVSKLAEPTFVLDMREALARIKLPAHARVLSLGVNTGDELTLIEGAYPDARFTGIDHDQAALNVAQERFPGHTFCCAELSELTNCLGNAAFDLVVSLDTLQSPGVDDRAVLRQLVQQVLAPTGGMLLGLPNCRYVDGELLPGARMVNFREPELSLLVKSLAFYRRYLHQHGRKVFITGSHELLLTAVPSRLSSCSSTLNTSSAGPSTTPRGATGHQTD